MFVALGLKDAMRVRHIFICELKLYILSTQCFVWASEKTATISVWIL